jgi:hypothetical protein
MVAQNPDDIEEQRALSFVGKSMSPPKGILLADTCERKWLTRKPGKEEIMGGDMGRIHERDITGDLVFGIEIGTVGLLRKFVHLASENTLATNRVKPPPQTANPCEKINEFEEANGSVHDYILLT